MAESVSLAVLENLVHMSRQDFPTGYVMIAAEISNDIQILDLDDFRAITDLHNTIPHVIGDAWIEHQTSAVLRVPSTVVEGASNYLLNPRHPAFKRIVVVRPVPFEFDDRLFGLAR
jgi:RES domain-containing protein